MKRLVKLNQDFITIRHGSKCFNRQNSESIQKSSKTNTSINFWLLIQLLPSGINCSSGGIYGIIPTSSH
jgi:hypothetical protein